MKYLVIRNVAGAEATIAKFETEEQAKKKAEELALKFQDHEYCVCEVLCEVKVESFVNFQVP